MAHKALHILEVTHGTQEPSLSGLHDTAIKRCRTFTGRGNPS